MPNKDLETSVYRISGCAEEEVWLMGMKEVAPARGKPITGRGDLLAAVVYSKSLSIKADQNQKSRHADIVGWPGDKDRKQAIAMDLAVEAEAKKL
jgi:hypothetical protein